LALDGGDEGAVHELVDLAGHLVAGVLEVAEPGMAGPPLEQALGQLGERVTDKLSLLLEQVVEAPLSRHQAQSHPDVSPLRAARSGRGQPRRYMMAPSCCRMRRATATAAA